MKLPNGSAARPLHRRRRAESVCSILFTGGWRDPVNRPVNRIRSFHPVPKEAYACGVSRPVPPRHIVIDPRIVAMNRRKLSNHARNRFDAIPARSRCLNLFDMTFREKEQRGRKGEKKRGYRSIRAKFLESHKGIAQGTAGLAAVREMAKAGANNIFDMHTLTRHYFQSSRQSDGTKKHFPRVSGMSREITNRSRMVWIPRRGDGSSPTIVISCFGTFVFSDIIANCGM